MRVRKFYDYDEHSRVGAKHGEFVTDEICDRFCVLGTAEQATAKLKELESIGVDQFNIYLMTQGQEQVLTSYGEAIIPQFRRRDRVVAGAEGLAAVVGRNSGTAAQWGIVAPGWARQRSYVWDVSRAVAERLVEALDPQPGETILELAAGPGDTGFSAAARLGPDRPPDLDRRRPGDGRRGRGARP